MDANRLTSTADRGHPGQALVGGDAVRENQGMGEKGLIAAALAAMLGGSGCAMLFTEGPSDNRSPRVQPQCTTGKGWVYFDYLVSTASLVSFLVIIDTEERTGVDMTGEKVGAVADAAVHTISALVGESRVNACRKAHSDYEELMNEPPPTPPSQAREEEQPGFFCTVAFDDTTVAACNKTKKECVASQTRMTEAGHDMGPCNHADGAICFRVQHGDATQVGCAPSMKSCERHRQQRIDGADGDITISDCADAEERGTLSVVNRPPPPPPKRKCVKVDGRRHCFDTADECEARARQGMADFANVGRCEDE